ncbi:hypothetical protein PMIN05_008351 [Paraphaeosphaeria minitans]
MVGKTVATINQDLTATKKWLGSFLSSSSGEKAAPIEKMVQTYCFSPSVVPTYKTPKCARSSRAHRRENPAHATIARQKLIRPCVNSARPMNGCIRRLDGDKN